MKAVLMSLALGLIAVQSSFASERVSHHLTKNKARELATGSLQQQPGISLSDYDLPTVTFDRKYKKWEVCFGGKSHRIADWVIVVVDDRTSKIDFHWAN